MYKLYDVIITSSDVTIPVKDTDKARKTIGFCPQHNILISELNVDEHFKFFAQAGF